MQRIISKHQHSDGLIGLWPQNQMLGTISYDFGPNQGHGTHVDTTNRYRMSRSRGHYMNATGYDAKVPAYTNILTAALIASFDGNQGAAVMFCKTDAAWAEGINRYVLYLGTDTGHTIEFDKTVVAGGFRIRYNPASGHSTSLALATMDWFCVGMVWDNPVVDEAYVYYNGVLDSTFVTLPAFTGTLDTAVIGASSAVPADVWDGGIGLVAIYDEPKTPAEMLYLSTP